MVTKRVLIFEKFIWEAEVASFFNNLNNLKDRNKIKEYKEYNDKKKKHE